MYRKNYFNDTEGGYSRLTTEDCTGEKWMYKLTRLGWSSHLHIIVELKIIIVPLQIFINNNYRGTRRSLYIVAGKRVDAIGKQTRLQNKRSKRGMNKKLFCINFLLGNGQQRKPFSKEWVGSIAHCSVVKNTTWVPFPVVKSYS